VLDVIRTVAVGSTFTRFTCDSGDVVIGASVQGTNVRITDTFIYPDTTGGFEVTYSTIGDPATITTRYTCGPL
jgi:hypothetical protein